MAQSWNDIQSRGLLKYNGTASATDVLTGGARIFKVSLTAGTDNASMILADAATVTGADLIHLKALANTTSVLDLEPKGHAFSTGLSTTLAGTSPLLQIYYTES